MRKTSLFLVLVFLAGLVSLYAQSGPPSSFTFGLRHSPNNVEAAQKAVVFWFNGDKSTSVTVPWGDYSKEFTVIFKPGQETFRIDAEFADGSGGHVFVVERISNYPDWEDWNRRYYCNWGSGIEISYSGN